MTEICSFWKPTDPVALPSGMIHYLSARCSDSAVSKFLSRSGVCDYAWRCVRPTLSSERSISMSGLIHPLWALARESCGPSRPSTTFACFAEALEAMSSKKPFSSTITIIKMKILSHLHWDRSLTSEITTEELEVLCSQDLFPLDTKRSIRDRSRSESDIMDAQLYLLTEFLESCSSAEMPYRATDTLKTVLRLANGFLFYKGDAPIPKAHRIKFAANVHAVFTAASVPRDFLDVVVKSLGRHRRELRYPWLTVPIARQNLTGAFKSYESTLSADPHSESSKEVLPVLRAILDGLGTSHANPDPDLEDTTVRANRAEVT
ncbi:hypothetical protein DFH06DRAFT_1128521 [Mycena polygramma]|nr:hypothetical protein DFH06DRAFT_1128521 [Mycena polygramma]